MGLTLTTWYIGMLGFSGFGVAMLLLGAALVKGQLVGSWFMGLREVRGIWGWVITIWLWIPGSLIALAFYFTATAQGQ